MTGRPVVEAAFGQDVPGWEQPLFLRRERARVSSPDEDEGAGHADRFVFEDRDAAGAETGQVPLEAAVEFVVPGHGEDAQAGPELAS